MRIIITVKCKDGEVCINPKLDASSKDTLNERHAGEMLLTFISKCIKDVMEPPVQPVVKGNRWLNKLFRKKRG